MASIAYVDLVALLAAAGFTSGTSQATGLAVVAAESGRDPAATNVNTDGSIDRGLWQINNRAHPEVTDEQAFDPARATAAAFTISRKGTDYSPWSAYQNLAYRTHMEAAKVALDGYSRMQNLQGELSGLRAAVQQAVTLLNGAV